MNHYHKMHSHVNYESAEWYCIYIHILGDGKRCVRKCCNAAGSQCLHLYMQIRVVLGDEKHCGWSEGNTMEGVRGVYRALPGVMLVLGKQRDNFPLLSKPLKTDVNKNVVIERFLN